MKKEKDTKIVRNRFSVSDSKRMESYLETMAGQGWMLDKTERLFWRFRKTAPRKLHFSVIYMNPDDGILQSREDLLAEFRARCVRDGWTPVASDKYFQVICTDREHPDEIKTDPSEALASMHQAAVEKNGDKVSFSVLFFLYLLFSTFTFSPLERLSGGLYALSCLLGLAGILLLPVGMLRCLHWEKAMRKAIQHATPPPKKGPGDLSFTLAAWFGFFGYFSASFHVAFVKESTGKAWLIMLSFVAILVVCWITSVWIPYLQIAADGKGNSRKKRWVRVCSRLLLVLILAGTFFQYRYLEKKDTVRYEFAGTTELAIADKVQLDLAPLLQVSRADCSYVRRFGSGSPWLRYENACITTRWGVSPSARMEYQLVTVLAPCLHDRAEHFLREELPDSERNALTEVSAGAWRALHVYSDGTGNADWILADYGDCLLLVEFGRDFVPDDTQIGILVSQFGK